MSYVGFFCLGSVSILSYVCIYSVIYLYPYDLMDIYSILWVIIQHDVIYFVIHIIPALQWELFHLAPVAL